MWRGGVAVVLIALVPIARALRNHAHAQPVAAAASMASASCTSAPLPAAATAASQAPYNFECFHDQRKRHARAGTDPGRPSIATDASADASPVNFRTTPSNTVGERGTRSTAHAVTHSRSRHAEPSSGDESARRLTRAACRWFRPSLLACASAGERARASARGAHDLAYRYRPE